MSFSFIFSASPSDPDKDQDSYMLKRWGCACVDLPLGHEPFHVIQMLLASLQRSLGMADCQPWNSFNWLKKFSGRAEWSVIQYCILVWYKSEWHIIYGQRYTIYADHEQAQLISGFIRNSRWNRYDQEKWIPMLWNADNSLSSVRCDSHLHACSHTWEDRQCLGCSTL